MWNTLKRFGEVMGILTVPRLRERHVVRLSKALDKAVNEVERLQAELGIKQQEGWQDYEAATTTINELRAQLTQAEIELTDKAFYVREFAAVSAERDGARADIDNAVTNAMDRLPDAPWKDKTATEAVWLLSLAVGNANAELAALKAQLDETERQLQAEKKERFAAEDELAALKSQPGWDLDVTWEEMWKTYTSNWGQGNYSGMNALLDLCRSRIRPTYECKECVKKEAEYQDLINATNDEAKRINRAMDAINAARAALEDE